MEEYTQDNRLIRVETTLGKDVLLLQSFSGEESVSDLFNFTLSMHSTNHDLPLDSLIGQKAAIAIKLSNGKDRYINGIISDFSHTGSFSIGDGSASSLSHYQATLVPWLWTLQLNRDCRIFQNKTVPDIIYEIFGEHYLAHFEMRLIGKYSPREYCVQYRESDFNFVSRLMEEEGIFYFFEHTLDKHTLILADQFNEFKLSSHQSKIDFQSIVGDHETKTYISNWQVRQEMRSDRFELRDFNFRNPNLNLTTDIKDKKSKNLAFEVYEYPGEYENLDLGAKLVRLRYEEEKSKELRVTATTNGRGFSAGFHFSLEKHPRKNFNQYYVLLKVRHEADQSGVYRSSNSAKPFSYTSELVCTSYPTDFRPNRKTPIPKVQGTQTAIVVGPKGEEIFTDEHGRVKVQFHWDRLGRRNENSSCWIRVSQPWAGTGFGGMTIPRIGQEVIVDFLEGDPDRPIITGRVYNGASRPPYSLPANKAHSGLMSRSTPKGGSANFNGIRMDDNAGVEGLEIQAEKDQRILVKNDKAENVGNNETIEIGVDRTENVGNNQTVTIGTDDSLKVGNNQTISIGTNRTEDVGSNESVKIGSNRNTTVGSNDVLSVGLTRTHSVGINEAINIGAAQEISIGAVQIVSIGISQVNTIGLKQQTNAGKEISMEAPKIILKATEELTLKCGTGVITINAAGIITIKGPKVLINT